MRYIKLVLTLLLFPLLLSSDGLGTRLVTEETWRTPMPVYVSGGAVWYAPGVMETNCEYRGFGWTPGVALMSPSDIGKYVWLRPPNGLWEGPYPVCDCAMQGDMYAIITDRNEVVEVGWTIARSWGMGPHDGGWIMLGVEVFVGEYPPGWHDPLDNWRQPAMGQPVDYQGWFLEMAEYIH
jgi:hypothetical protein